MNMELLVLLPLLVVTPVVVSHPGTHVYNGTVEEQLFLYKSQIRIALEFLANDCPGNSQIKEGRRYLILSSPYALKTYYDSLITELNNCRQINLAKSSISKFFLLL